MASSLRQAYDSFVLAFLSLMYVRITAVSSFDLNLDIFWFAIHSCFRVYLKVVSDRIMCVLSSH